MIAITLNFTSIEAAIRALREIPENLLVGGNTVTEQEVAAVEAAPAPKAPKAAKAAKDATSPATAAPAVAPEEKTPSSSEASTTTQPAAAHGAADPKPVAEASAPAAPAASPASSVDYPTLQKAVFALAGKSREAAAAVVQSFGVKTFKELPQDKWAEALGAVTEKLAELEAA